MAHLPPKAPNMATSSSGWPDNLFSHQRVSSMDHNNPSWVDEFFDFSSSKRGSHRRSISDSVAFLEMPLDQECGRSSTTQGSGNNSSSEFDRFDDEQLMSMFTDDVGGGGGAVPTVSCSNPSSPSDPNSVSEDNNKMNFFNDGSDELMVMKKLKNEPEEVDSSCKIEGQLPSCSNNENSSEKLVDPKRIKRILANRQSAQRSRVRKLQYISELERSVTSLQAEVSVLSPRVAYLDQQRMVLTVDNGVIKQRMAALAQDQIFKDAHQEALKREIERLRQIYYQQNMNKMEDDTQTKSQPSSMDTTGPIMDKEQLVN
ncbi:basic leucine zipper transcription factor [Lithospermum erythrorhizon]|uniref:Basic leucine zipper transcription factor n=1 Tax=Lithospermum erythrorhizon TaxID=34254 RepID=A0AAV3RZY9_LITER